MNKTIKLMADYDCFPIWEIFDDGTENIDPEALEISNELKQSLNLWSDLYDQTMNIEDPVNSRFASKNLEDEFEREGQRLWSELKKQLSPIYRVLYFSEESKSVEG
jgi:hypothetical protein